MLLKTQKHIAKIVGGAAAVGLGIWGVSSLFNSYSSPSPQVTEAKVTQHSPAVITPAPAQAPAPAPALPPVRKPSITENNSGPVAVFSADAPQLLGASKSETLKHMQFSDKDLLANKGYKLTSVNGAFGRYCMNDGNTDGQGYKGKFTSISYNASNNAGKSGVVCVWRSGKDAIRTNIGQFVPR